MQCRTLQQRRRPFLYGSFSASALDRPMSPRVAPFFWQPYSGQEPSLLLHPFFCPVFLRGTSIFFSKDPMKITHIFISHRVRDVCHRQPRRLQKKCGLLQPFFLKQLCVSSSRHPVDHPAHIADIVVEFSGQIAKLPVPVMLLNITVHRQ